MTRFEESIPLACRVAAYLEGQRGTQTVTIAAISEALNVSPTVVIQLFEVFGVTPVSWEAPSDYEVAAIVETLTRHEFAYRASRVTAKGSE